MAETILKNDLKIYESAVPGDFPESGGRMSGREVEDGESNQFFPDVSDVNRITGRTAITKAFVGIASQNNVTGLGLRLALSKTPSDPKTHAVLFSTRSHTDKRLDALNILQSYLIGAYDASWTLMNDQLQGVDVLLAYQAVDAEEPKAGETFQLTTQRGPYKGQEQFVRVSEVESSEQEFTESDGKGGSSKFKAKLLKIKIQTRLDYRFYGRPPSSRSDLKPDTEVKVTTTADASRFFGMRPLTKSVSMGNYVAQVDTIFEQLAPSAQSTINLLDESGTPSEVELMASGNKITMPVTGKDIVLPRSVVRGSLVGTANDEIVFKDDGFGKLLKPDGIEFGSIDNKSGRLAFNVSSSVTVEFIPATPVTLAMYSFRELVEVDNRRANYTFNLTPPPAPGSLKILVRIQGKWYFLRDNGKGELYSDKRGVGTGIFDFQTNSGAITLSALPDIGTPIIYFWGTPETYIAREGVSDVEFAIRGTLSNVPKREDVVITWNDGQDRTARCNKFGVITGDAGGTIDLDKSFVIYPKVLPAPGTVFTIKSKSGNAITETPEIHYDPNLKKITGQLSNLPVLSGNVNMKIPILGGNFIYIKDDGNGKLIGECKDGSVIDYATGQFEILTKDFKTIWRY